MKKYSLIALVLLAGISAAVIIGSWYAQQKVQPRVKLEPIKLSLSEQIGAGLVVIALKKGFFTQEGLDVNVTLFPSGKLALEKGIFGSKLDIANTADVPIALAACERHDFKIIATIFSADNINRIVANRQSGILTPNDLRGKRIATQRTSAVHFYLSLFLLENRINISDVNLMFMEAEQLPKALYEGKIDAFSMRDKYVTQAQNLLGNSTIIFESPGLYAQTEVLVASEKMIRERPETTKKFLKAIVKAETYMQEHMDESLEIIAKFKKIPKNKLQKMNFEVTMKQSLMVLLEDEARWAMSEKLVDTKELPDFGEFFDDQFLKNIKPDSVTIIH